MDNKQILVQAVAPIVGDHLSEEEILDLIEVPKDTNHGDLAFPVFTLARVFRKAPQQIAQDIVDEIDGSNFAHVEAVGPYINVKLKREPVGGEVVKTILEEKSHYGNSQFGKGRNVTIDFSSPNIAKPMSMGHLRSTVIGNAVSNLLEKVGYNPIRINHLGDWGTQFGRLIVAYQKWGDEETVKKDPVNELVKLYVDFHERLEEEPELEEEGRLAFKRLEDGDEEMIHLWEWFKDESLKEFQKVYDMLEISFDSYNGEAFYNDKMQAVIDQLEESGLSKIDQGATIVDLEKYDLPPALIRKSDGATLYATRDITAALYRKKTYDFAKNIYVVGNEQRVHFEQLKCVLKEMGYDWADDIVHVAFGLITLDGKKLSTRKGKVVLLEEVLNEAIELAMKQIQEKNPDLEHKEEVAHQVGVGAVVFHDLKNDRRNNFDFDLEEIVQFEGETGPYVQYTYARSMSILRRADYQESMTIDFNLNDDYSWEIVKKLVDYPSVVNFAAERYEPSAIAKYALQLAQLFNKYYANVRILDEDDQLESRLALVNSLAIVLKDALKLLGVHAPSKM